jgi:hypothetical protein
MKECTQIGLIVLLLLMPLATAVAVVVLAESDLMRTIGAIGAWLVGATSANAIWTAWYATRQGSG